MDVQRKIYREDHEMFRTTVRRFLEREYLPGREHGEDVDRSVWLKAGREGLLCVMLPAQFGGGGDFGHAAVVREEFARAGVCDGALSLHSDVIAPCIALLGSEEQQRRWLPGVCSGEAILALAVAEPQGKFKKTLPTQAIRNGDQYVINGSKVCVGNGMQGNLIVLACRIEADEGLSLIMVETDRAGLHRSRSLQSGGQASAAELFFDNVRVPLGNLLGEAGRGMEYLNQAWGQEHLLLAIFAARRLEHLLQQTLAEVQQPDGNGGSRWDLPYTRLKLAGIKARTVGLRILVDYYLGARLRLPLSAEHSAIANLNASETLRKCSDELTRLRGTGGALRTHSTAHALTEHGGAGKALHEIIAHAL
ncbi:Acyl-CoA dehydrogenase [compost metagenome]